MIRRLGEVRVEDGTVGPKVALSEVLEGRLQRVLKALSVESLALIAGCNWM